MERTLKITLKISSVVLLLAIVIGSQATRNENILVFSDQLNSVVPELITPPDTNLPFPFEDNGGNPYNQPETHPLFLGDPSNIKTEIEYDPENNEYIIHYKVGGIDIRPPYHMTLDEYFEWDMDQALDNYWQERASASTTGKQSGLIPKLNVGGKVFESIFGSNTIDIRPQGSAELIFGINASRRDDPALDEKQRKTANFDFQEKIQMNVVAKIGDKIELGTNYNTEATFDFENKMKLAYEGKEDEIIQLIEAGDVTLPLNGTLITGSQSLFGIKTALQFGRATVTSVFSQQKSETSNITVDGGAQTSTFELRADDYEENKHFFIAQYFRDNYNRALENLPIINSPVNITKLEVWVTNIGAATTENRNITAFQDLGERDPYNNLFIPTPGQSYPDNNSNTLPSALDTTQIRNINTVSNYLNGTMGLVSGIDFEKVENARKLTQTEYTFNSKLGFISLNTTMNPDQVLAVSYQYTIIGDTTVHQVGEFSNGGVSAPNCLIVKLLKSTALDTEIPMWDLMMKNVYSIGGYQINSEDFRLNILYSEDEQGVPAGYLSEGAPKGLPLIRVLNLDNLNTLLDPIPDGVFDFIDNAATNGGTINAANGRIYFPILEPFGSDLAAQFNDTAIASKYVYQELYDLTKNGAQQLPEKNKFLLEGMYKSASSSEISLNAMNIPQGSVKVTAGGIPLTENVDYTVDYTLGRVRIINEGILNSGTPINISLESNSLFNIQTKTLLGSHVDYRVSKDFSLGATVLNLTERPLTQKINFGDEPISNTIWGIDATYTTQSRLITKMIDWIPFIETKAPSSISFNGEFAHLIPGHSKAIGKSGTSYIDDFEGSKSKIDMKNIGTWFLASTPQGQPLPGYFPEAEEDSSLAYGFNRAKLAWYVIDPLFVRNNNLTPDHIQNDLGQQSNHFVREILETEVFPNKETPNGQPTNIAVLNLAYYPSERGPYNYDVEGGIFSSGLNADGTLKDPQTRWGGIMRKIETTDFESTNVEYIEFWVMDPFIYDSTHPGGQLYFNLGDISEDVLKDGRKSYENGLPTSSTVTNVDSTIWGRVPTLQALVNSFDNDPNSREFQDVGYDGLGDNDELTFFDGTYIQRIANAGGLGTGSLAYQNALDDPSGDNYHYYRGSDYDNAQVSILDRYKKYNGMEGNSPTSDQSPEVYPTQATTLPNVEDINRDNTLSETERYFQYRIDLKPEKMNIGENYITDILETNVQLKNGSNASIKWYQFKIPVSSPDMTVGNIQDFKSIRFMRMFLKNFSEPVVLRFATLDLVRGEWRKYQKSLVFPGEYIPGDEQNGTTFDISAVNIEENGKRYPVPYTLPPDIEREINLGTTNLQKLNEQSLVLKTCNLIDGDARAAYKTSDFDFRRYKKLKMYVHAETSDPSQTLIDGDLTLFVRLGTDFINNFYEYEIPLAFTPWGTSATDVDAIWPEVNQLDLELDKLVQAKMARNVAMRDPNSGVTLTLPYYISDGNNTITVMGTPNISDVKTIMIGIRNPKKSTMSDPDDGQAKCAEVWVNELRLTDFDEEGGWAANARVNMTLADFGNLILAGSISTPGFGSIEQKVNERQKEQITQYDIATNLELGKFFPEKSGIRIPMHFDYSEMISTPEYDPLNPDIKFKESLETYETKAEKDSIRNIARDYTKRKNINFINVRKNRTGGKSPRIYDIENFDVSYSYSEINMKNVDVEYDIKKQYKGGIGYNYSISPKPVRPFSKSKFLNKHKAFRIIRDFNFYYLPKLISVRTDMDRLYQENMLRNKSMADIIIEPTYIKTWSWNRLYDFKYDLTQGLRIDYNARANARVDEPPGKIDKGDPDFQAKRDTIWENIKGFGRITTYDQTFNVNYNVPINKLPLMNWLNATARYGGEYHWTAAPLSATQLGNEIENGNTIQLNTNANMNNLYNSIPYIKKLNQQRRKSKIQGRNKLNEFQEKVEDSTKTEKPKVNYGKLILDNTIIFLTAVKNVSVSYTENNGIYMPGFLPSPVALGQDWNLMAPGTDFVFGWQRDIRGDAVKNGWLTTDTALNTAYSTKHSENLNARATLEPFRDFRIEVTANRNFSIMKSEYFKADRYGNFDAYAPVESGNFSISYLTWNTAFIKDAKDYSNENFEKFKDYRMDIAIRLANNNPNWNGTYDSIGFPTGYSATSQDVLIPAFLAAYTGRSSESVALNPFPKIPFPNWRVTYNGLAKIDFFRKYVKSLTLSHSYRSTYNVGSFTTNVLYREDSDGFQLARDAVKNFIPRYEINQISITEQFAPLINIDFTLHNSLMSKIEIKKTRDLAMSFANNQLTEVTSNEWVFGLGYRFKEVALSIRSGGRTRTFRSDLNIMADVSIRSNKTVLRKLVEDVDQISAGQRVISINTSADYMLNDRFQIRLFFDKIITNPFVSSQFPNSNTNAGISLRFTLAQ